MRGDFFATAVLAVFPIVSCFSQPKNTAAFATAAAINWTSTNKVSVADKAVGMTAYTVDIPAGWHYAGMILRPGGCHAPAVAAYGLSFTTVAPDGVTAYSQLPGVSWDWASDGKSVLGPKCHPIDLTTAPAFLLNIVIPNMRPDARNIAIVPLTPQMQAGLEAQRRNLQEQAQSTGRAYGAPAGRITLDSARVRLEYQLRGQAVEELIGAAVRCEEHDTPAYPQLRRPARTTRTCQSLGTWIRRAPKGSLDAMMSKNLPQPQIDRAWDAHIQQNMRSSFAAWQHINNEQFAAIQKHYQEFTAGLIKHGEQVQAQLQDQTDHAMAQDRATQSAIDHAAQQQVRDSLNRQLFVDPSTGRKIETSNQYTHNWISSDGSAVVLNSDPTLDPNGQIDPVRQSWTELVPINY